MGQTVVFTVSLDADDVAIDSFEPSPPRHPVRDAALTALRDRNWRLAFLACLVVPTLAASGTFLITGGAWGSTVLLVAAALTTAVAAAWAGASPVRGVWDERAAGWLVVGAAGGLLALASVPGVLVAGRLEGWGESGTVPTLVVLALVGAASAWFGCAVSNGRRAWPAPLAAVTVVAIALAPLAVVAAMIPQTTVTEQVTYHRFLPTYAGGRPAYICSDEAVEVSRRHTDDVAWMAFASPLVWAVDAAAFSPTQLAAAADGTLAQAQAWTRSTRVGPDDFIGHCYQPTSLGTPVAVRTARYDKAPPLGAEAAAIAALLGGAFAGVRVIRRKSA